MNQAAYDVVAGGLMQAARDIEDSKRPGYTRGDEDVLANFKRAALQAGISTEQAWAVFFLKHVDAIVSIMTKPDLVVSEEPIGRFSDAVNYLRLGFALLNERESADARIEENYKPAAPDTITIVLDGKQIFSGCLPSVTQVSDTSQTVAGWQAAAATALSTTREIEQSESSFGYVLEPHAKMGPSQQR